MARPIGAVNQNIVEDEDTLVEEGVDHQIHGRLKC